MEAKKMCLGPVRSSWTKEPIKGGCRNCGLECDGEDCGLHKAGCIWGGWDGYWIYDPECKLFHGV